MKTTLVIIVIVISAIFATIGSLKVLKECKRRQEPTLKKLGFVLLAFTIGAIGWPGYLGIQGWNWLKTKPLLKITIGGLVLGGICYAILYFGCLFS